MIRMMQIDGHWYPLLWPGFSKCQVPIWQNNKEEWVSLADLSSKVHFRCAFLAAGHDFPGKRQVDTRVTEAREFFMLAVDNERHNHCVLFTGGQNEQSFCMILISKLWSSGDLTKFVHAELHVGLSSCKCQECQIKAIQGQLTNSLFDPSRYRLVDLTTWNQLLLLRLGSFLTGLVPAGEAAVTTAQLLSLHQTLVHWCLY